MFDDGSYRDIVRENIRVARSELVARGIGLFLLSQIFARFLFGLYVGRRRWAERSVDTDALRASFIATNPEKNDEKRHHTTPGAWESPLRLILVGK